MNLMNKLDETVVNPGRDKVIANLQNLIVSAEDSKDVFLQVGAARVLVAMFRKCYGFLEEPPADVAELEAVADKASLNFGLMMEIQWDSYYRSSGIFSRHKIRKNRDAWLTEAIETKHRATIEAIHKVVLSDYHEAMKYHDVNSVFTDTDRERMRAGNL